MSTAVERRPWPSNPRVQAGSDGSVVGPSGRVLRPSFNTHGYLSVSVRVGGVWKTRPVHSIVCEAFHGPRPDGMEVAHGNGDKADCSSANLSWKTRPENHADKIVHGTAWRGEKHHKAKLTVDQVRAIRIAVDAGIAQRALARQYGVSRRAISFIVSRQNWGHVA